MQINYSSHASKLGGEAHADTRGLNLPHRSRVLKRNRVAHAFSASFSLSSRSSGSLARMTLSHGPSLRPSLRPFATAPTSEKALPMPLQPQSCF